MDNPQALVLITGANSSLGFAVAQELAISGSSHVLIGARTPTKADTAIGQLLEDSAFPIAPAAVSPVALDLAQPIIRAATAGDPNRLNGTLVADELTEFGW